MLIDGIKSGDVKQFQKNPFAS